jgi:hypothetical protein
MQVYQRRKRDWVVRGNGKVGKSGRARPGQLVKYMFVFLSLFLARSGAQGLWQSSNSMILSNPRELPRNTASQDDKRE